MGCGLSALDRKLSSEIRPIDDEVKKRPLSVETARSPSPANFSVFSVMENRPPSGGSNTSLTRVYRNRSLPRPFTIDTSRARSNQPVVSLCARKIGLEEFPSGRDDGKSCDIYWHNIVYGDMRNVVNSASARVNKFPGISELSRKIALTHAISSMQRIFPEEYSFYPKSWFGPAHLRDFQRHCQELAQKRRETGTNDLPWFIVKPDEGAQGAGIYLINGPEQLRSFEQRQLIQEYVTDPFLMADELKFDFRVYGVIKSINPLSIYVAREGMARFCTEKYSKPTAANFENLFAHLTNYSLNKASDAYVHSHNLQDQQRGWKERTFVKTDLGSKRLLSTVFHQMEARGVRTKRLWHNIKLIVVKTVLAMLPEIMLHYEHHFGDSPGPQCFQIMGFDILVTKDGTPVLLEVNSAPSLTIDHCIPFPSGHFNIGEPPRVRSIVDEVRFCHYVLNLQVIKIPLVRDTLLLVLDLLDEEYGNQRTRVQIFPTRYGASSGHLLFLDKAVYLYMHFVNLRATTFVTPSGIRSFVKKCNLLNVIQGQELDLKMAEINYFFTGDPATLAGGLPFHGFLQLLFHIAEIKFPYCENLLSSTQRLMAFCDASLRHYGIRSARLRRTELDTNSEMNPVEIYMLPTRMRGTKGRTKSTSFRRKEPRKRADTNNNNALILPKINA